MTSYISASDYFSSPPLLFNCCHMLSLYVIEKYILRIYIFPVMNSRWRVLLLLHARFCWLQMKGDSLINLNAFLFYLYRMFSSTKFVYATFSSTPILYYLKEYLTLGCGMGASTGGPPSSPTNAKLSAASHQTFVVNSSSSLESAKKIDFFRGFFITKRRHFRSSLQNLPDSIG